MKAEFSMWGIDINDENFELLRTKPNEIDKIIIYTEQEYDLVGILPSFGGGREAHTETLIDISIQYNIPVHIVIGLTPTQDFRTSMHKPVKDGTLSINFIKDMTRYKHIIVHYWGTYWFSSRWYHIINYEREHEVITQPDVYTYPFISMNGRSRHHRCVMIDALHRRDLISKAAISWNTHGIKKIDSLPGFYVPPSMWLTETYEPPEDFTDAEALELYVDQNSLPLEYNMSFAQLVTETTDDKDFITEKTVTPLFEMKPFICVASTNFHTRVLRDYYGFKLYDELFDYSFENVTCVIERCRAIAREFEKISMMSNDEMHEMYNKLKPKLEYNRQLAINIALDASVIPQPILDTYNDQTREGFPDGLRFTRTAPISYGSPYLVEFLLKHNNLPNRNIYDWST